MVAWQNNWKAFDAPEGEEYFLSELAWEIETNKGHPLYGKEFRIVGWIPYFDDFLLLLPKQREYVYVHFTWRQEDTPTFPYCKVLGCVDEANAFIAQWEA